MSEKPPEVQVLYYEGKIIKLVNYPILIRKGICDACGRSKQDGIKTTSRHHCKYAYELDTVRKKPELALENSLELCYSDHQIGDGLRQILLANPRGALRNPSRILQVVKLLPPEQQDLFRRVCRICLNGK